MINMIRAVWEDAEWHKRLITGIPEEHHIKLEQIDWLILGVDLTTV